MGPVRIRIQEGIVMRLLRVSKGNTTQSMRLDDCFQTCVDQGRLRL